MENENTGSSIEAPFKFLENSDVKEKFADLNIYMAGRVLKYLDIISLIIFIIFIA